MWFSILKAPVEVLYHPYDPEKAEINSSIYLYLKPILFMVVGIVSTILVSIGLKSGL